MTYMQLDAYAYRVPSPYCMYCALVPRQHLLQAALQERATLEQKLANSRAALARMEAQLTEQVKVLGCGGAFPGLYLC